MADVAESVNFYRISSLVLDVGPKLLRHVLRSKIENTSLAEFLKENFINGSKSKLKLFTKVEIKLLTRQSPPPDFENFDITLLNKILRNVTPGIGHPKNGWDNPLDPTDYSLEADLKRVREIRNSVPAHTAVAKIKDADFERLWNEIEEVFKRLSSGKDIEREIQNEIDDIRCRSLDTYGTNELKNAASELTEELLERYENTASTVEIFEEWDDVRVEHIYTPVIFREDLERQLNETPTVHKATADEKEPPQKSPNYKDMFLKDGILQKEIYLLGKAGIGKSMFCVHLIDLWSNLKKGKEPENEYERLLAKFDFVFYLLCREAAKTDSILQMICKQICMETKKFEEFIKHIFEKAPNICLILLDGLDEWSGSVSGGHTRNPGLPSRAGVAGSVILTTSRPWRIEALPKGVGNSCRVFELEGLNDEEMRTLSKRLLTAMDEDSSEECSNQFVDEIRKQSLCDIASIPLMLTILAFTWQEQGRILEKSLSMNYRGMLESFIHRSQRKLEENYFADLLPTGSEELPSCFANSEILQQYSTIIMKLAHLAFDTLVCCDKENSLVFIKSDLSKRIGESDLSICLRIGLLSQAKVPSKSKLKRKTVSISFVHKSLQEFLAAVYMEANFEKCLPIFIDHCQSLKDAQDFKLIIVFLSGLFPAAGRAICQHIGSMAQEEEGFQKYNQTAGPVHNYEDEAKSVRHLQDLLVECLLESHYCTNEELSDQSRPESYSFTDIYIDNDLSSEVKDILFRQLFSYASIVQSVVFENKTETPLRFVEALKACSQVKRIQITSKPDDIEEFIERLCGFVTNSCSINSLGIQTAKTCSVSKPLCDQFFGVLESTPSLKALHIEGIYFEIQQVNLHNLTSVSLWRVKALGRVGSLFTHGLTHLSLRYIELSHESIHHLCEALKSSSSLEDLAMTRLDCTDDGPDCRYQVDLTNHKAIHTLVLSNLWLDKVQVSSRNLEVVRVSGLHVQGTTGLVLRSLADSKLLRSLAISGKHDSGLVPEDLKDLRAALLQLTTLENVDLYHAHFKEDSVLECDGPHLRRIRLFWVHMIHWSDFIHSLPKPLHELKVILHDVDIDTETEDVIKRDFVVTRDQNGSAGKKILHFHTFPIDTD